MKTRILSWFLILVLLLALLPGAALAAPAEPTGLVAREVTADGQLIGPLMTELQLHSDQNDTASISVIFFYVDPATGEKIMLQPEAVSSPDEALSAYCGDGGAAWLPVIHISASAGDYTLTLSGTANGKPYTYPMACHCRTDPPAVGLYDRQERSRDALVAYSCDYLDLPEHALWYLAEGGLTRAQADDLVVQMDNEAYPFTPVQNASGTYDVKIDLPLDAIRSYSYGPTLTVHNGAGELHLVIRNDGVENLPGLVIRHAEGRQYGEYRPGSYISGWPLTQAYGDQFSYLFYYGDHEGNLELLDPDSVHSTRVIARPLNDEQLPVWIMTYIGSGEDALYVSGRRSDGTSYTYDYSVDVRGGSNGSFYLTQDSTDPLLDKQIAYNSLTDGTLWAKASKGVSRKHLSETRLTVDNHLLPIAAPGQDTASDVGHWVLRNDGNYDLKLTLPRPARRGSVQCSVGFFGSYNSCSMDILDRVMFDGQPGILYQPYSPNGTPPEREIVAQSGLSSHEAGSFLCCDEQGVVRVLAPTAVTVENPEICTVSREKGNKYLFTPRQDGETTVTVTADGQTWTLPLHAYLFETALYTSRVRHADNLLSSDSSYGYAPYLIHSKAETDTLWILTDGGFTQAEARAWTCAEPLAILTPVLIDGSDRYDLRVDVKVPPAGETYLFFDPGDYSGGLGLQVKPYAPIDLVMRGAHASQAFVNIQEPVEGWLLLALYDPNGQMLRLDLQELHPGMAGTSIQAPWYLTFEHTVAATALGQFFQPLGWPAKVGIFGAG